FVAQTVDWNPPHLYATIKAAYEHQGTSFIRILQRCPHFTSHVYAPAQQDLSQVLLMDHENGITLDEPLKKIFRNRVEHNPSNLSEARELADRDDVYPIGVFYKTNNAFRYDQVTQQGLQTTAAEKLAAVEKALDRFTV